MDTRHINQPNPPSTRGLRLLIWAAALCVLVTVVGCTEIAGSSQLVTAVYNLTGNDLDKVTIRDTFVLTLEVGTPAKLTLSVNQNIRPLLMINTSADEVEIGLQRGVVYKSAQLTGILTLPSLRKLRLHDQAQVVVAQSQQLDTLEIEAKGESSVQWRGAVSMKALNANLLDQASISFADLSTSFKVQVTLHGEAKSTLSGRGPSAYLTGHGASTANLSGFQATQAIVTLFGNSQGRVKASESILASLFDSSSLLYSGGGRVEQRELSSQATLQEETENP